MVAARNDFEEFLLQQGFPPERAYHWASALERAAQSVTREDLEEALDRTVERAVNQVIAVMREEFAKRDIEFAELKQEVTQLVNLRVEDLTRIDERRREDLARSEEQRQQDLARLADQRREDLARQDADRRERRAVALAAAGAILTLLLRVFGAI